MFLGILLAIWIAMHFCPLRSSGVCLYDCLILNEDEEKKKKKGKVGIAAAVSYTVVYWPRQ